MHKFLIVLAHTYWTRLKSKAFIITTAIIILFMFAFANLESIINLFADDENTQIVVLDDTGEFYFSLEKAVTEIDDEIELTLMEGTEEAGKKLVNDGEIDGFLVLLGDESGLPTATYYENDAVESKAESTLVQQLQQLKTAIATENAGVDEVTLSAIFDPVPFEKIALDESAKTEEELDAARGIVYVMLFVLYMAVIIYGQMIALDVVTEKSSRVMEILISSAPPVTHMFAKIIGIALLGLTQMLILFGFGYQMFALRKSEFTDIFLEEFGFTAANITLYVYALIFFILGYLLYGTIAAMLGSLVSRVEDAQQLTMPMILLIMVAFFIAMFGLSAPDATFITITSYIPFFTPMIMFLRIGMLEIPIWEIALSLGLLIGTIVLFAILGARIYRGGVLMYGPSRSLKDFKKALQLTKKE